MADDVRWNTDELKAFARSLNHDKDGRALKKQMQSQFDSITEDLRDKLRQGVKQIPRPGQLPGHRCGDDEVHDEARRRQECARHDRR